ELGRRRGYRPRLRTERARQPHVGHLRAVRRRGLMSWRALLKGDPVPWLLERSDPAVRAQTLRSLLDRSPRDPELRDAQQRAMSTPPISTILRRQKPDASWPGPNLYGPKYEGTHWARSEEHTSELQSRGHL